jgi:hypothetical protein
MNLILLRVLFGLGLFFILAAVPMSSNARRLQSLELPNGMTSLGIAIELVENDQDFRDLTARPANIQPLQEQQQLDRFLFIPAYLMFFAAAGAYAIVSLDRMRWTGYAIIVLTLAAAICDYCEDSAILYALAHRADPHAANISWWAYPKWAMLYLMLTCTAPLFWRRWNAASLRILGLPFGLYAAFSGGAGLVACAVHHGGRIESAASGLAAPVLFFVFFAPLFYWGVVRGLTRIANFLARSWFTKWIVLWPAWKDASDKKHEMAKPGNP